MYEQISKVQFESIMENLQEKSVWLKIHTNTLSYDILFELFEFLNFVNGKYQFGVVDYQDWSNDSRPLLISQLDILKIHRNIIVSDMNGEQVILTMSDNTQIFLEYNC